MHPLHSRRFDRVTDAVSRCERAVLQINTLLVHLRATPHANLAFGAFDTRVRAPPMAVAMILFDTSARTVRRAAVSHKLT
jgi:hypothetical protein